MEEIDVREKVEEVGGKRERKAIERKCVMA